MFCRMNLFEEVAPRKIDNKREMTEREVIIGKAAVQKWMQKFEEGVLAGAHFREHWRIWVPRVFIPEQNTNCLEWTIKDHIAQPVLIESLEEFICHSSDFLKYLSTYDYPPSVCGKVFKMGEPTYNCRECGMDLTCVLCVNCFKQSAHKNHKYKMGTSGGGGCCDCGDTEAWKSDPYCETHLAGVNNQYADSVQFPQDLIDRASCVFTAVLQYCYEILTLEHSPGLPGNLKLKEDEELQYFKEEEDLQYYVDSDLYCTVLYNDETHTFEQVVNTLARVIKCSQRDALDFVTNIDREGRAVVKCSTFQHCNELKIDIEKFTSRHGSRPVKVLVVHSHVIAHQMFALRLLTWLQKLTTISKGFRKIFTSVALNVPNCTEPEYQNKSHSLASVVEGILLRDSLLWKSARLHWHRLFISGMFMEYENKKAFAKIFTNHYGTVLKDFIRDDHDHSFSIASLSIQMFTVPTLAQYLIAHEDVLFILLNTFISECSRKCNKAGKLEFDRATSGGPFKRAIYILYDLRHLLGSPPQVWTDELRKGFLQGVSLILTLLTYMQEMDSVTRQVGQHMEYEPEWESAFNLHIKLAPVITLILKWCSTDQTVLIKAYRLTLKKLFENPSFDLHQVVEVKELADHSALCHQYDVSTQPVSIHLPLSRFLAGLYLHLEKFGLSFYSPEFYSLTRQTPQQIIEPVLRTQVMIAQVHAGMWRRNGYSLSNQIYFYHNVKCRGEMLDKDIVLLQFGASLIESNEFLIHILNKFGLLNWASADFETNSIKNPEEDGMKPTVNMVEEFLSLLITIIGERYVPGVGKVSADDCIKNEIIHQLFIKPLSHSELNKTLPDDVNHETGMENVIDAVATFKKPGQGSGKGVYSVKPEFIDKYNVFFYHYTKEELSKSEEEQRKQRKTMYGYECCPPPVLPCLNPSFNLVANLLQCDVMLHIMKIVLERSLNLRSRSFSEAQLHKVLHLIGYALQEQEQQYYVFMNFTTRAEKWNLEYYLEELYSSQRVEAHKDLIQWTLNKYRAVARPVKESDMEDDSPTPLQTKIADEQQEKLFRAKLAAERRAAIMAQMAALQQNFMKDNAALFQKHAGLVNDKADQANESELAFSETLENSFPIALGPNQSPKVVNERTFTCILCQEDQVIRPKGPAMVLAAFVQKSTVLVRNRNEKPSCNQVLSSNLGPAPHVSTCGHVMHSACWKKYIETILSKENRRPYRLRQPTSFDIERNEYLCPLCECLNNTVLPVMPNLATLCNRNCNIIDKLSFSNWYEASLIGIKRKDEKYEIITKQESGTSKTITALPKEGKAVKEIKNASVKQNISESTLPRTVAADDEDYESSASTSDEEVYTFTNMDGSVESSVSIKVLSCPEPQANSSDAAEVTEGELSDDLIEMINLFTDVATEHGIDSMIITAHDNPLATWRACAYTIHSLEWLLRYMNKPLLGDFTSRQQDGLENLIRSSGVLGIVKKEKQCINRAGVDLLGMLFNYHEAHSSVLDWDCFGLLVPLTVTMPSMYFPDPIPVPLGTTLEMHSFKMVLLSHFAQTIICTDMSEFVNLDCDVTSEDTVCLIEIVSTFKDCSGINTIEVWALLKNLSKSFLRCCAIFYHFLTGVAAPQVLKEVGGDTFENIMHYLGMPASCKELLDSPCILSIFRKWAEHPDCQELRYQVNLRNMIPLNELVELPDDYSELINTVSLFTCPNSDKEDSRNPTMCLICGEMLCSQTYCCQTELHKTLVGACTNHTYYCGAGAGIFLRVRECEILLLASPNRGCFMAPPYLDDYGEADQGLRRGNPLHLCKDRYRKLQLLWLSHSIQEEIARAIESSQSIIDRKSVV